MQETCVTVTWMRVLARLLMLTGEVKYLDRIERSAFNALYGSANLHSLKSYSFERKLYVDPIPFDSYSPLYNNRRGRGVGGYKEFKSGGYYGCCACIAAAGVAILPLVATLKSEKGVLIGSPLASSFSVKAPSGEELRFSASGSYPAGGSYRLTLESDTKCELEIAIRVPSFAKAATWSLCGGEAKKAESNLIIVNRCWQKGDYIELYMPMELKEVRLNGKTAYTYGELVLARDSSLESGDISAPFTPKMPLCYDLDAKDGALLRLTLKAEEGDIPLVSYADAGKRWDRERANISVWLNAK